jgi:hypothetical protein
LQRFSVEPEHALSAGQDRSCDHQHRLRILKIELISVPACAWNEFTELSKHAYYVGAARIADK